MDSSIFGYTGQHRDRYIKLIYMRSRMYDPASGRFLTKNSWRGDNITPMSYTAWLYVNASPINYTDPSGHFPNSGTTLPDKRDLTDWLPRAAVYMATDPLIQGIKRLNSSRNTDQQILAFYEFYNLVHAGARFDVKIKIKEQLGRSIKLGEDWYEYSSKGNFMYGLYRSAAGFGVDVLHAGAGSAQVMDLLLWLWTVGSPCDFPDIGGLQHYFDTPDDAFAIDFGIWS
jgi:RHS repeat-associated protein